MFRDSLFGSIGGALASRWGERRSDSMVQAATTTGPSQEAAVPLSDVSVKAETVFAAPGPQGAASLSIAAKLQTKPFPYDDGDRHTAARNAAREFERAFPHDDVRTGIAVPLRAYLLFRSNLATGQQMMLEARRIRRMAERLTSELASAGLATNAVRNDIIGRAFAHALRLDVPGPLAEEYARALVESAISSMAANTAVDGAGQGSVLEEIHRAQGAILRGNAHRSTVSERPLTPAEIKGLVDFLQDAGLRRHTGRNTRHGSGGHSAGSSGGGAPGASSVGGLLDLTGDGPTASAGAESDVSIVSNALMATDAGGAVFAAPLQSAATPVVPVLTFATAFSAIPMHGSPAVTYKFDVSG